MCAHRLYARAQLDLCDPSSEQRTYFQNVLTSLEGKEQVKHGLQAYHVRLFRDYIRSVKRGEDALEEREEGEAGKTTNMAKDREDNGVYNRMSMPFD